MSGNFAQTNTLGKHSHDDLAENAHIFRMFASRALACFFIVWDKCCL